MDLPTEEQVAQINDGIAILVYGWARRIEALATKYKIRGQKWKAFPVNQGRFGIGCESVNGARTWGVFYYQDGEDPRDIENCRLTVKLDFLETAVALEEQYLKEVGEFYERAQKVVASAKEKGEKEPTS